MKKLYTYRIGLVAALAGLLFGLDIGVISGALSFLTTDLHLNVNQQGWVVSSVLFSAAAGALASGWLSKWWGRRNCILFAATLFGFASLASALAANVDLLILARVFLGLSVGIATYNAPIYLSEIAPAKIRGSLVTFYQFMITLGIVVAFLTNYLLTPTQSWRLMLGVIAIPAFIMTALVFTLPKSPRWLMLNGQLEEAENVLKSLLSESEYQKSVKDLQMVSKNHTPIWQLLKQKPFVSVVLLGVFLQVIQQFSGMNGILYFAPEMFKHAGYSTPTEQLWATFLIGMVNMITTIFAIRFVESFGRRKILFLSGGMILFSALALAALFMLNHQITPFIGNIALFIIFVFIIGFAIGYGPVIWTLCAEVFPLNGRSFAMSCATMANWTANGVVGFATLRLINGVGVGGYFLILAGFAILSLYFFKRFVPETKQVPLETIEKHLMEGKPLREIGS